MEQLISFLMDHFFIVVIVIGLIYTMFFRKSPLENRPSNRMPDFGSGGGPGLPQRPRQPGWPAGRQQAEHERPRPVERRHPAAEPAAVRPSWADAVPEAAPVVSVTIPAAPSIAAVPPSPSPAEAPQESAEGALRRDDLTRAVIWAEILGPPRSRRPYRR
ncbi:hypothetical protein E5161_05955 [Cohnella pontilimi]|uniref:Uncharacterized protein n=1 Tax=Cohnella pontilimi TaxID=2564100 RepID=A0A4U0FF01_9BACL|nr:hypothetical protein [Cohnella pontilimi]TJY43427.1 hypothetical protein E5161_05955 [Cohnella pontilimi]